MASLPRTRQPDRATVLLLVTVAIACLPFGTAEAGFRYSILAGYGASGVQRDVLAGTTVETVSRSESPVAVMVGADYPINDQFSLGLEHSRGIRLAPFSSGISFSGMSLRWHFGAPIPMLGLATGAASILIAREWSFFAGLGLGIASAAVKREFETVSLVEESGFYFAPKAGAEIPLMPGVAGHLELQLPSASGSAVAQGTISALHVLFGITIIP